jgi:2',3'-cyclic-nucleotide 2'-phosphodiesterase (5'-nucleotidase family)
MKNMFLSFFILLNLNIVAHAETSIPFVVFHTNDLHSHLDGIKVPLNQSFEQRGGFARLSTLIKKIKKENEIAIGVDAGDFFAGTIFSAIALSNEKDFPEYQFFMENKYDLLTLGNHEFDPMNKGLEIMLQKASLYPKGIPLVASNLFVTKGSSLEKHIGDDKLIRQFLVKEFISSKGNIKVGFLGVLGPDGCLVSRSTREDVHFIGFDDTNSKQQLGKLAIHLNKLILKLRKEEGVDIVILTMHGGGKESFELAEKLKGLNILISGHTHKKEFAIVNGIVINQTGSFGENLGFLEFNYNKKSKKLNFQKLKDEHVIVVENKIEEDLSWKNRIDNWRKKSFELMGQGTVSPSEVIFTPKNDYIRSSAIPNPMGTLLTKSLLIEINKEIKAKNDSKLDEIDAYFTSMGLVRTSFFKNIPYTRSDIFEAVSIGYDSNMKPGSEVVSFYLTPKEVKLIISFMEIYTYISTSFSPAISPNLSFKIRKWGIPFINRIYDLKLNGKPLEDYDRMIKIATNKFVVLNIETVKRISRGWIELLPKTKEGEAVINFPLHPKEYQLLIEHFKANPKTY